MPGRRNSRRHGHRSSISSTKVQLRKVRTTEPARPEDPRLVKVSSIAIVLTMSAATSTSRPSSHGTADPYFVLVIVMRIRAPMYAEDKSTSRFRRRDEDTEIFDADANKMDPAACSCFKGSQALDTVVHRRSTDVMVLPKLGLQRHLEKLSSGKIAERVDVHQGCRFVSLIFDQRQLMAVHWRTYGGFDATTERKSVGLWWFPPARWLAEYRAAWLPGDIVAGITLGGLRNSGFAWPMRGSRACRRRSASMAICWAVLVTPCSDPRVSSPSDRRPPSRS